MKNFRLPHQLQPEVFYFFKNKEESRWHLLDYVDAFTDNTGFVNFKFLIRHKNVIIGFIFRMQPDIFVFPVKRFQSCSVSVNLANNDIAVMNVGTRIAHSSDQDMITIMNSGTEHTVTTDTKKKVFARSFRV